MTPSCVQNQRWEILNQAAACRVRHHFGVKENAPGTLDDGTANTADILIGGVFRDLCQVLELSWSCEQMARWVQDCARARWILDGVIVLDAQFIPRLTPISRAAKEEGWTKQDLLTVKREALAALGRVLDSRVAPPDIYDKLPKLRDPKQKKRTHDYLRDAWIGWAVLTRVNNGARIARAIREVAECTRLGDDAIKKIWLRHRRLLYVPKGLIARPPKKEKQTSRR